ncbi:hypothetical protein KFU94_23680 [Chloroflexi bacterium TSY]|nr:hypothetical protein [Chloroflexi bacterium TSY]
MNFAMNRQRWFHTVTFLLVTSLLLVACVIQPIAEGSNEASNAALTESAVPEMMSAGVLHFGPNNELFVGDSKSGTIFAFNLEAGEPLEQPRAYNLYDIDLQIAAALGATIDQITINDMAVHPVSSVAYLSVMRGHGDAAIPVVLTVDHDGNIEPLDLAALEYTSTTLDNLPDEEVIFWKKISARTLSITDIDYYEGALYVAGLSTGDFASTLRRIPYPLDGTARITSVEMYHTVHNQNETRAPVRTQTILEAEDGPILLAAYTCTPLVTTPLSALEDGAHITAKTIAEVGYGNTPIDIIRFQAQGQDGSVQDMVILTNTDYSAMIFGVEQLLTSHEAEGLVEPVGIGMTAGPEPFIAPLTGVLQISDQDPMHLLMLRTNKDTDNLDLVSTIKGVYFRLSDFISEYDSVGYEYPADGSQDFAKGFQNMLRMDEGYPDRVVP